MQRKTLWIAATALFWALGCEDGPKQVFHPNQGNPAQQNGYAPVEPWTPEGQKGFGFVEGGDEVGRAKACSEPEIEELNRWMVVQPLTPDVSVGGIPLWGPDGKPIPVDDLLGGRKDGRFCDPSGAGDGVIAFGAQYPVLVFFNTDTRLVESVAVQSTYEGALAGAVSQKTKDDATVSTPLTIKVRDRINIGGVDLDEYASSSQQASKTKSWVNHQNVTAIYGMLRQTFFNSTEPLPAGFDCVTARYCDINYEQPDETKVQGTTLIFRDSGVVISVAPDGYVLYMMFEPIRVAPFESLGSLSLKGDATHAVRPTFQSALLPECTVSLDQSSLSFGAFRSRCLQKGDEKTLARASYNVASQRDMVFVGFNGVTLAFERKTSKSSVFKDGETPAETDQLAYLQITRSLDAKLEEFNPRALAEAYVPRLLERIKSYIRSEEPGHPLLNLPIEIPADLKNEPEKMGELFYTNPAGEQASWVQDVVELVQRSYYALPIELQQGVDPQILDDVRLVEPFLDAVLDQFTHQATLLPGAIKEFQTTDNGRWSIATARFVDHGAPYRITAQYSLYYGALTALSMARGYNEVDEVFQAYHAKIVPAIGMTVQQAPYYLFVESLVPGNPYGLGGKGIKVKGFDRKLTTLLVDLTVGKDATGKPKVLSLVTPGTPRSDNSGYSKQIRGDRYEFVPADNVLLSGRETTLRLYVEASGTIGLVTQYGIKGPVPLCDGLNVYYGDQVKPILDAWRLVVGEQEYARCEVVFNYSDNGNVLDSVTSLANRISVETAGGRAINATAWR